MTLVLVKFPELATQLGTTPRQAVSGHTRLSLAARAYASAAFAFLVRLFRAVGFCGPIAVGTAPQKSKTRDLGTPKHGTC